MSRAQPAAPKPSIQRPRAAWSSEGDPPIPAGCGYLWQAAGQLRLCSRAGRGGSGVVDGCPSVPLDTSSPSP